MYNIVENILVGYTKAKKERFAGNPMGTFFRNEIPNRIYNTGLVNRSTYLITGSVGQGNWATVPWICIFDRNITTSATKGVYVVYLLAKDGKTLYLTFNQGCTDLRKNNSKTETIRIMRQRATEITEKIDSRGFKTDEDINLGDSLTELAELYQKGTIFYKAYHKDSIPSNKVLLDDLKNMMDIYKEYSEIIYNKINRKAEFFRFLGPIDSLNGYQKSYKLVLYKVMLDLMDKNGKCYSVDVANKFRQFYVDRVTAGKISDVDVDKRIEFIKDSSIRDAYNVIIANPFKVISDKGFMHKTNQSFELEQICFDKKLIAELTDDDISEIKEIVDKKLDLYFSKIDGSKSKNTWLLAWNPNNWDWKDFDEAVKTTREGVPYNNTWACSSNGVIPGDRFFMITLGTDYNGIMASGYATSEQYEYEHWDPQKRAEGKMNKGIDIAFDYIVDIENEDVLAQSFLKSTFPDQHWSPQASGISIKNYYVDELEKEWQKIKENDWWPSLSEYNPGITKEKWLELLNNSTVFTESALKMMADFYAFGGTSTCIQLAERYNKTYNYYLMTSVHLAERVVKTTGCPTIRDEKKAQNSKWWPVLYVGRDADKQEKGSFVWKIRDELYEALTEFGIEKYLTDNTNIGGEKMTTKEKIEAIKNYIASEGFNYEGNLIENFYLSLKSKPFVILAGTSGTGKTRLVKLFAKAIGAKMKLVPVRPDWSDSSDLFGHTDLSGKFQPGAIIDFIKQAEWDSDTPYFLCLDEMNLARVEYYLSDFLSVIETRDRKENGDIETEPLVDVDYYKDKDAMAKYGRVFIPDNLYIIGTVNMDETTFPFSKKVLDRANTIEFSYVNLMAKAKVETIDIPRPLKETNSFLKTEYLYLKDCDDTNVVDSVCFDLNELNSILVKANLHVGYRVRDEISFYMMNNKNADLLSKEAAFDNEIMQKILPRIQGSSRAIKDVLSELFKKFAGDYTGLAGATDFEQMQSYIDAAKDCKYPNSAKKIAFMMRRYEEDGFTSYWL